MAETPAAFIRERLFLTADLQIQGLIGRSALQSLGHDPPPHCYGVAGGACPPNINKKALGKLICFHQSDTGCATNSGNNCSVVPRRQIDQER